MIHAIHIIFAKTEPTLQALRNACCTMTTTKTMKSIVIEQNNAQRISATVEWSSTQKRSTTMEHNNSPITKVSITKLQNEN
jgi:hypothetical protein